ncbi:MAG: aa3-type cytochrome c oxidase subunit IV [Rhizomicrobium sp.]|jgi:hypothetical protein
MAARGDTGDRAGTTDISEHLRTWKHFTWLIKWSLIGIGLIMVLLAIFRTHG